MFILFLLSDRLQEFSVETAIAVRVDGGATLRIDTQNLRDIHFRIDSLYQFIGEILIQPGLQPHQVFYLPSCLLFVCLVLM